MKPANLLAARRKFRIDRSSEWRDINEQSIPMVRPGPEARTRSFLELLPGRKSVDSIRVVVLGDTGEGGKPQYGLLPLIRALDPHFMIINGDLAYPAGRSVDYIEAFFEPYNDLGIPIWAVPGNHEYYSRNKGREFVDVFCTRKNVDDWKRFGLRFVPQPGTYWELSDKTMTNVSIIGIDSGHSGNLDSVATGSSDARQMEWLKKRLNKADLEDRKVILLFHIPVLVNGELAQEPRLARLHRLIGESKCVKAVICGHIHSFQAYEPTVFGEALRKMTGEKANNPPQYIVSGGGGAFLSAPPKADRSRYKMTVYPNAEQWERRNKDSLQRKAATSVRRGISKVNLSQSVIDRIFASMEEASILDTDKPSLLSLLYVEIKRAEATITPVFLNDLGELYPDDVDLITIRNRNPHPDNSRVAKCKQASMVI